MEDTVRKCNCPYCRADGVITKDKLDKDGALKCQSCGETYFVSVNDNNEIETSREYHHKQGEERAFCNCPYCNCDVIVTREQALNNEGTKCIKCGEIKVACLNLKTNTIELLPAKKKRKFNSGNNSYVYCSCPYCRGETVVPKDKIGSDGALKCMKCGETYFISENQNNEIEFFEKYQHKPGEERAFCNCPYCNCDVIVTREQALNNEGTKCIKCGGIKVASLNPETNTIEILPVTKRKRFTYGNNGYVFCNCPACQQANVFSDLFEVNQCNYCGTDLYLQMSEDDVIASCLEVTSRSHR